MCVCERERGRESPASGAQLLQNFAHSEFCASVRHQRIVQLRCESSSGVGKVLLKVLPKVLFFNSGLYSDKRRSSSSLDGFSGSGKTLLDVSRRSEDSSVAFWMRCSRALHAWIVVS